MPPDTPDVPDIVSRAPAGDGEGEVVEGEVVEEDEGFVSFAEMEWPRPWMGVFLDTLARVPFVTAAAEAARINRQHTYDMRGQHPEFAEAWDQAKERGIELTERIAHRWGTTGLRREETREKEIFDKDGKLVSKEVITTSGLDVNPMLCALVLKRFRPEYRESVRLSHEGPDGGPIQHEHRVKVAAERFEAEVLRLAERAGREA